ncbi:MAG: methylmalonyl-CoA mutase family protein [Chloroflexota bacterium]
MTTKKVTKRTLPKTAAKKGSKLFSEAAVAQIKDEQTEWEESVLKEYPKKKPETRAEFRTGSGDIAVKEIYTPADIPDFDYSKNIGLAGQYPFTRGIYPNGWRSHEWPLQYYSGFGTTEDTNKRFKELLAQGASNVTVACDLPTQIGYDSDDSMAAGEVGKVGVAICSLDDLERLYEGLPVDRVSGTGNLNCLGPIALAFCYVLGEKRGVRPSDMQVGFQNDPFKEYTGRGTFSFPPRVALALAIDVVEFCSKNLPRWWPQHVCTTQMRWGGCTAAEEVAFGLANLVTYLDADVERGIKLGELVPKMHLHMTADNDLFEEAAKFRATRRLWAKIATKRYETKDPRVVGLRITNYTGAHRMTAQQPMNNIVRSTMHTLACMLGGVDAIMNPAYDEALALPTVESTRLAALTRRILHYESGTANTVDPLAGSYYVESLTDQIQEQAQKYFDEIEAMGGALAAIESGYYLKAMADGMVKYQREVESEERIIVGVNKDVLPEEVPVKIFMGNPEAEKKQIANVKKLRAKRDKALVKEALAKVRAAAEEKMVKPTYNTVPVLLEATRAYCTIGEIRKVWLDVFGEYKPLTYY